MDQQHFFISPYLFSRILLFHIQCYTDPVSDIVSLCKARNLSITGMSRLCVVPHTSYTVITRVSLLTDKATECEAVPLFPSVLSFRMCGTLAPHTPPPPPKHIFTVHSLSTGMHYFCQTSQQVVYSPVLSFAILIILTAAKMVLSSVFPGTLWVNNFKIRLRCFFPQHNFETCYSISHSILRKFHISNSAEYGLGSLNKSDIT
jgi:hypothetical protein